MRRSAVDPASLEGEELERWYRRTPDEVARERAERQQSESDDFYGAEPWREARATPPVMRPPLRVAPPMDVAPRPSGDAGSFFGTYPTLPGSGDFITDLPAPLNALRQSPADWNYYLIGDGSLVRGDEVERIYAEQRKRIKGDYSPGQKKIVRTEDRLPNGVVPSASQLQKGVREVDPTCHPNGGWEIDPGFSKYPKLAQDYEAQVTRSRGIDYVVRNPGEKAVKFDGCAVWSPRRELLEAKGPRYAALFAKAWKSTFGHLVAGGLTAQSKRQEAASRGRPIDWHAAEAAALEDIRKAANKDSSYVHVVLDPPRLQ